MATTMHWLPNFSAASRDEIAVAHGGGHDRDLVGAGEQQRADVVQRAHAAAHRQRHEADIRRAPHDVEQDGALLMARGDVEEAELVRARRVIEHRLLDRIARIAQIDEIDALDDAPVLHVEAGNDADFQHASSPLEGGSMGLGRAQRAKP